MTDKELLTAIKGFTARRAVGASAVRNSEPGTQKACQQYLATVNLSRFGTTDRASFKLALNRATDRMTAIQEHAPTWGLARKLLNIFLRDSLYTIQLREAYGLALAEKLFELPLDSITAKCLKRELRKTGAALPNWTGVGALQPQISEEYQDQAQDVARRKRVNRVDLDAVWWSGSRDETKRKRRRRKNR